MKPRVATTGLILLLVMVWLGFLVHRTPRFAGSAMGVVLGIAASVLMVLPLLYTPFRRSARLRRCVSRWISVASLLQLHVLCGLLGAVVAIAHTGHRFEHPVGIALTALVLLVSASGYVGYELLRRLSARRAELTALQPRLRDRLRSDAGAVRSRSARALVIAIADIELTVATSERTARWLRFWRVAHVGLAVLLFAVLGLHVWTAFYFGVRW